MVRRRLDQELVRRELADSRAQAQHLIESGRVLVAGSIATKPARQVDSGEPVVLAGERPRYVSRGGEKLHAALEGFGIDVTGLRVLDAGASTGGFTDCVLQRGAATVVAVDVGHGQLHERLRADHRVEVHERCNVRHLAPADIGGRVDMVVGDLSFISLKTVLPALVGCVDDDGPMMLLVKPQFEAGRSEVGRGRGVIRDSAVWRRVLGEVSDAAGALGVGIMGMMVSPLHGADGNTEFLLYGRARSTGSTSPGAEVPMPLPDMIDAAVVEAEVAADRARSAADGEGRPS